MIHSVHATISLRIWCFSHQPTGKTRTGGKVQLDFSVTWVPLSFHWKLNFPVNLLLAKKIDTAIQMQSRSAHVWELRVILMTNLQPSRDFCLFFFIMKFIFSSPGGWLLYNVVLVSAVQQSEWAMCIHKIPSLLGLLPTTSHHASRSSHSTELSSLGWVPSSFQLVIYFIYGHVGSLWGSAGKESACNAGDLGLIPGLGRSPEEVKGYLLQYSGLENSMDYTVHGVAELDTTEWLLLSMYIGMYF